MSTFLRHGLRSISKNSATKPFRPLLPFNSCTRTSVFSSQSLSRSFTSKALTPEAKGEEEEEEGVPKSLVEAKEALISALENDDIPDMEDKEREKSCKDWIDMRKATVSVDQAANKLHVAFQSENNYSVEISFSRDIDEYEGPGDDEDEPQREEEEESEEGEGNNQQQEGSDELKQEYQGGPQQVFHVVLAPASRPTAKLKYTCHASKIGEIAVDHLELSQKDGSFLPDEKGEVVFFEELKSPTRDLLLDVLTFNGIDDETAMFVQSMAELERQKASARQLKKLVKWLSL